MFKEYELNLLGIDEFHINTNSRLRFWYEDIRKNADREGDIFEFGVYRGASLIAVALILKEIGSDKIVYGFDSFDGFPSYSSFDDLACFEKYRGTTFSEEFLNERQRFLQLKRELTGISDFDPVSIASSGSFSGTSRLSIDKKLEYFKLDNVRLIEGDFKDTIPKFFDNNCNVKISSANLDCDLYEGYDVVLPSLFKHLASQGYVHLDEYYSFKYPGAKIACDKFFQSCGVTPQQNEVRAGEFERWYFKKDR